MDSSRCPRPPYTHQVEGVERLVQRVEPEIGRTIPGCLALFDEPGAGKSRQIIDAATVLHERGELSHVIVLGPAQIREMWFDQTLGEIATHGWANARMRVIQYHSKQREWRQGLVDGEPYLTWIVTNYEYIRVQQKGAFVNLQKLLRVAGPKTLLVCDESLNLGNYRAKQTKAAQLLRDQCGWVVIMNGTPDSGVGADKRKEPEEVGSVGSLYSQARIMHPAILGYKNWWHFRAVHGVMGGWRNKQVVGWRNVELIQRRMAPYVLRRMKRDCLDLPEKLPPVLLNVALSREAWKKYKEMREESVVWLGEQTASMSRQAGAVVIRLAQITSGFVGGVKEWGPCYNCQGDPPGTVCVHCGSTGIETVSCPEQWLGTEKLDLAVEWVASQLAEHPAAKMIVWCRFRPELQRLVGALSDAYPNVEVGELWGQQSRESRLRTLHLLKPGLCPEGPAVVAGIPAAGGVGLDFAAARAVLWLSHGTSLPQRLQADERPHRPGQVNRVWYGDVVATGPDGQRTVDHTLVTAMRRKENAAAWTCSAWERALRDEEQG